MNSDDREVRAARNQAMFRYVNEKMLELDAEFDRRSGACLIACECADVLCIELVPIPRRRYEDVRKSPHTFVVLPTHVFPEVERLVATEGSYAVVEVTGAGTRIAEETDPRAESSTPRG